MGFKSTIVLPYLLNPRLAVNKYTWQNSDSTLDIHGAPVPFSVL